MENYTQKLITRRKRSVLFVSVAFLLSIVHLYIFYLNIEADTGTYNDGFLLGFQFGLIMVALVKGILDERKLRRTLKDEKAIRLMYNEEHDERMQMLRAKSGAPMIQNMGMITILVAIVIGYFNFTVFYTLVSLVAIQMIISLVVYTYHSKKV